jgi:hypothetical protein
MSLVRQLKVGLFSEISMAVALSRQHPPTQQRKAALSPAQHPPAGRSRP